MALQNGLVRTNENCVGCNKCIGVCSCIGAMTASRSENGDNIINVDGDKCIACGACFDACEHNAREYEDDTEEFFKALENGEKISILIAPAFYANYPDEYKEVLGGLKQKGVNHMVNVSFGADITTWGYINYIQKYNFTGGISQPCPAAVNYIEQYLPELLPNLMPVQSPMMCAAIYVNKVMGIKDKLAFISPCIAKKKEIMSKRGKGLVSYNVTFEHLMRHVREYGIYGPFCGDEVESGLGSLYPMPGGLKENIYWFLGEDAYVRQREGEGRLYGYLEANKDRIKKGDIPYLLVDVLNCEQGCLYGTGTERCKNETDDVMMEMMKIKKASKNDRGDNAWSRESTPEKRLLEFNKQFSMLDLNDFLCEYTDNSAKCRYLKPSREELEKIFYDMGKTTEVSRKINCSSCGYEDCEQMAMAIYNGYNHKENCIHYKRMEMFAYEGIKKAMMAGSPEQSIKCILEYIGKRFDGDRAYIFEKNERGRDDNTYEWIAEGMTSEMDNLQDLPEEICGSWYQSFSEDKAIIIKDLEDIKVSEPLKYKILKAENVRSLVVVPLYKDGEVCGFYGVNNPLHGSFNSASEMLNIMGYFIINCIHRRDILKKLKEISLYDQLTNLGNRHAMNEYLLKIDKEKSIGVVFCDVTGLKRVNDTEGHKSGDRLIINAARCLEKEFSEYGLFRIGGDEFIALCSGITKEKLEEGVGRIKGRSKEEKVNLAVGSAWAEDGDRDITQLAGEAETAMYKDKADYYRNAGIDRRVR